MSHTNFNMSDVRARELMLLSGMVAGYFEVYDIADDAIGWLYGRRLQLMLAEDQNLGYAIFVGVQYELARTQVALEQDLPNMRRIG